MTRLKALYDSIEAAVGARAFRIIRYLSSGGTAAASNIIALFLLVHIGHIYYLYASVIAFTLSIAVSFTLQKFWTFHDMPLHDLHIQFTRYLALIGASLMINTVLVYLFVEKVGMWYVLAQILATVIIAIINYIVYRLFVFRERP